MYGRKRTIHCVMTVGLATAVSVILGGGAVLADGGVTFTDVGPVLGTKTFGREPRFPSHEIREAEKQLPVVTLANFLAEPVMPEGVPGIVVFDYDNDGALDIFVTNGTLGGNALFRNLLADTGKLGFVNVADQAGVSGKVVSPPFPPPPGGVKLRDNFGACAGDINNDGKMDLLVLGSNGAPNSLYVNNGNGTFTDVSMNSGLADPGKAHTSCSMGDVNGDGLVDVYIGNSWDSDIGGYPCFADMFQGLIQHDQLFINNGDGTFTDVSASSGIQNISNRDTTGLPEITWSVAMIDWNQDGAVDIITNSDNCAFPGKDQGGVDRGFFRVLQNDGTGHFTEAFRSRRGAWMGIAAGDLNCDGNLDFFGSNFGDHGFPIPEDSLIDKSSTVFLGGGGTLTELRGQDLGLGSLPFGWGNGMFDYDNDGDLDIVFYGGLQHGPFVDKSNPGMILQNQGSCAPGAPLKLVWDKFANRGPNPESFHTRRDERTVALGDLDNNGFVDIVSGAAMVIPGDIPLQSYTPIGSVVDADAKFVEIFRRSGDQTWVSTGEGRFRSGDLAVEMNSGNANGWLEVKTLGTVGLLDNGKSNRSGIGSVVKVTPDGLPPVLQPVAAGSSHASQHSLELGFGLADRPSADVQVQWTGGHKTCLEDVPAKSKVTVPEVDCNSASNFGQCADNALGTLVTAGAISSAQKTQLSGLLTPCP